METGQKPLNSSDDQLSEIQAAALRLWVKAKATNPHADPEIAIHRSLTGKPWPASVHRLPGFGELCNALNVTTMNKRLTEVDIAALDLTSQVYLYDPQEGVQGWSLRFAESGFLVFANWMAYALGIASMIMRGFSWWVLLLMVATWQCFGASRVAAKWRVEEERPKYEFPMIMFLHMAAWLSLVVLSVIRMLR